MKANNIFERISLKTKFITVIFSIVIILTILIFTFSYSQFKRFYFKSQEEESLNYLREVSALINSNINDIIAIAELTVFDHDLTHILENDLLEQFDDSRYEYQNRLEWRFNLYNLEENIIPHLFIVDKEGDLMVYKTPLTDYYQRIDLAEYILQQPEFHDYIDAEIKSSMLFYTNNRYFTNSEENELFLVLTVPIRDVSKYPNHKCIGVAYYIINHELFSKKIESLTQNSNININVYKDGHLLLNSNNTISQKSIKLLDNLESADSPIVNENLLIKHHDEELGLTYYFERSMKDVYSSLNRLMTIIVLIVILLIVLSYIIIYFYVNKSLSPLNNLISTMSKISKGNNHLRAPNYGNTEFGQLSSQFNNMLDSIKESERQKFNLQFQALQSQMNPHFIYNTLNTIRLLTIKDKNSTTRYAVTSLTKLFRGILGKQGDFVSISEEIEFIKSYVHLQQLRSSKDFEVEYKIDPEISDFYILKFIIQPLVENSILHGIAEEKSFDKIVISAKAYEGDIKITVADNGPGIKETDLSNIMENLHASEKRMTSIGLNNINQRLQLNYGEKYKISIDSVYNEYTKVSILVPRLDSKGNQIGEQDV